MSELESLLHSFLGVQPRVFGAVLVVVGLLQVAFGTLFVIDNCVYTDSVGIHFFPGILLFLAGIIAIAADRAPSMALVKACLVIQIIAATVVMVINFLYMRDLISYLSFACDLQDQLQNCRVHDQILVGPPNDPVSSPALFWEVIDCFLGKVYDPEGFSLHLLCLGFHSTPSVAIDLKARVDYCDHLDQGSQTQITTRTA
ncbi:uncharacterized protein RBU57_008765 isoform 1-T1 [Macrochelys suwanniensis]